MNAKAALQSGGRPSSLHLSAEDSPPSQNRSGRRAARGIISRVSETRIAWTTPLPDDAAPAIQVVRTLVAAGHRALLAGGCVRDLLRGVWPADYDVATSATPEQVRALYPQARLVGAQFGVVLVRSRKQTIEVATFRSDGAYLDGRRPSSVAFCDPEQDAQRRDFTINGMFLDPIGGCVIDFVGGAADLQAKVLRAIGAPEQRFAEDYLRLLRAVRFAARLQFSIEPGTWAALGAQAHTLQRVAPERVRDELERMLAHPSRAAAFDLICASGLLPHLWRGPAPAPTMHAGIALRLAALPAAAGFTAALAAWLAEMPPQAVDTACRALTCSNEQRSAVVWLVEQQAALDEPTAPSLAGLKRLMRNPAFPELLHQTAGRFAQQPEGAVRWGCLVARLNAISPKEVVPPPLITGADLLARHLTPGPLYKLVLDTLYEQQLDERLRDREAALRALDEELHRRAGDDSAAAR